MLGRDDASRLIEYTIWANHRDPARGGHARPSDDFKRDLGSQPRRRARHPGPHHGRGVDLAGAMEGRVATRPLDESEFADVVAVRERWTVIEDHRAAWFGQPQGGGPAEIIRYKTLDGRACETPLWQLVQHVANHSTYHRGQVITLLRILGARGVTTDMVAWDRERTAPPAEPGR